MKHLKKLMALILAVCMLVGMPLSLDVAATGQPNTSTAVTPFQAAQALLIPNQWNTGLDTEHTVSLYFTGDVTIDTASIKAYIALVTASGLAVVVDPVAEKIDYSATTTTIWDVTISRSTALGARNNYVVTLDPYNTRNYHRNCDTIAEILNLAQKTGLNPVVRLREATAALDNSLPSIYDANDSALASTPNGVDEGGCTETGLVRQTDGGATAANHAINCYDYVDIPLTDIKQAPSLQYVECNGTMIRPIFSHAMYWTGRTSTANPTHLRVVNSKGQIMYTDGTNFKNEKEAASASGYYAIGNYNNATTDTVGLDRNTFFTSGSPSSAHNLSSISSKSWTNIYNDCIAKCAQLNRSRYGGETYTVALVIEENESALYNNNGDAVNNWRIDGMWAEGYTPLTATHSNVSLGINDRVVVPVLSPSETDAAIAADPNVFTLKRVSISSTPGLADRVLVEFSKPVSSLTGYKYAGIRLYNASGNVDSYDGATGQWDVINWKKYNTNGTQWIGEIKIKHNSNTLAQIQEWIVSKGFASGANDTFTMLGGYRLEFAFADNHSIPNDRIIPAMRAADGSYLFANDSPFTLTGEERAGISYDRFDCTNPVNIEDVTIYANKYVLIDFDRDVTWWADLNTFYNGLCVYDQNASNLAATNGSAYGANGTTGYTTNLQKAFISWSYYGNRKDVVVATLADGDYTWLTEHLANANAYSVNNSGSSARFDLRLRLQDKPDYMTTNYDRAVDAITALDNNLSHLYAAVSGNWSTVYASATHHGDETAGASLTVARLIAPNKAILSFSTAITAVDHTKISLVSGSTTYPITAAEIDGNNVTVTFDAVALHDGMGIRIGGGADYRIPTSIITTGSGAVIYANETESSAYVTAEATEAVAKAKLNDTYYIDFQTAWAQRAEGDTLQLLDDLDWTEKKSLVVPAGFTLDLNSYTLTVPYFMSFGNVVDSTEGGGLVKVGKDTPSSFAKLQEDNLSLPLYDAANGGYRFFSYDIENLGTKEIKSGDTVTAIKYGIRLHFNDDLAYALLQDAANTDVSLKTTLTLRYPNATSSRLVYTFSSSALSSFAKQYPSNSKIAITLTVSGIPSIAAQAQGRPTSISIDTYSSLVSDAGVTHDTTAERYNVGISPAQAAENWINARISNHDLVSFEFNGSPATLSSWNPSVSARTETETGWKQTLTYSYSSVTLTVDITYHTEHASLEWVGNWSYTGSNYSGRISNVRILNAPFAINGAVMTTARQGGQNYIQDYQPYSIDLYEETSYSMANIGGRSSQGAWPYFDLTSAHNTYGIMGAIGWSGDWKCDFTYDNGTVTVKAGMQNTNYQMKSGEKLRTPSMVIQFFKGTQDDGHNAWRQLILDQYTPNQAHSEQKITHAPISINTWGGIGTKNMKSILDAVQENDQYFEYQWIDAGWYGNMGSADGSAKTKINGSDDSVWHTQRGNWYYFTDSTDPAESENGFPTANKFSGGFTSLNEWHANYQATTGRDTGLIVWFEPGVVSVSSEMYKNGNTGSILGYEYGGYTNPATQLVWKNNWLFAAPTGNYRYIDYGIDEAQQYVQELVLHYLRDMDADIYRQDFNINISNSWKTKDDKEASSSGKNRTGVAEIKYVMGHYKLLDAVLDDGRQIDNCASGGRMLDIEMMKRSIPLWRTDNGTATKVASGIRSQGANLAWWLPISGGASSSEGLNTEYGFRSSMASGVTMQKLKNPTFAKKMIDELLRNREMMLGDYYILQQGLHESLKKDTCSHWGIECWMADDDTKDYTDTTNAAYEYYLEEEGKGYLVAFRPNFSDVATETFKLKGLDAHADYVVEDADTGETFVCTGRYLMEQGLKLHFADIRTSHMIYFTKQ